MDAQSITDLRAFCDQWGYLGAEAAEAVLAEVERLQARIAELEAWLVPQPIAEMEELRTQYER